MASHLRAWLETPLRRCAASWGRPAAFSSAPTAPLSRAWGGLAGHSPSYLLAVGGVSNRATRLHERRPGVFAESPGQIPARGWREIVRRGWREAKDDNMSLMAAGVAYYGFLALVPTMIAATLLYGLVTSPEEIQRQIDVVDDALPAAAVDLLREQLTALASASSRGLGIGLAAALLVALWSASGGVSNLVTAINVAYDEGETRGFVRRKLGGLGLTLGAILFFAVVLTIVAGVPAFAAGRSMPAAARVGLELVGWLIVLAAVMVALAVLYRVAPDRDQPRLRWVSVGAVTAAVVWLVASIGFSIYVDTFGNYSATYGSLAGVVVLLLWLWLGAYAVLLGAEINAESEKWTVQDTTAGPAEPRGGRGAVKADEGPDGPR